MRYRVEVLGCKVNQYEAQQIRRMLDLRGGVESALGGECDLVVVHSCAVTSQAVRKVRQLVRRNRESFPRAVLVVSGCAAKEGILDEDLETVEYVRPGKGWLARLAGCLSDLGWWSLSGLEGLESDMLPLEQFRGHHRAFLKIQDGCDIGCSYCIVPSLRGGSRDKPVGEILREAKMLATGGHREVVLTGVSVGLYGCRGGKSLADVVDAVANVEGIDRLRLSSLHPAELTDNLLEVWQRNRNVMPHIHLPLQSGSDHILEKMGRGYTRADFLAAVGRAKRVLDDPAFNTDVIVGFPEESDADFRETVSLCREVGFARMHIFSYSPRPYTRASQSEYRLADSEMKERARHLRSLSKELARDYYRGQVGRITSALVESFDPETGISRGYTERYLPVEFSSKRSRVGGIVALQIQPDRVVLVDSF